MDLSLARQKNSSDGLGLPWQHGAAKLSYYADLSCDVIHKNG
jgi:hypothetical protein